MAKDKEISRIANSITELILKRSNIEYGRVVDGVEPEGFIIDIAQFNGEKVPVQLLNGCYEFIEEYINQRLSHYIKIK